MMSSVQAKTEFVDFRLIVNKTSDGDDGEFVAVVAEAPVSRWGYRFDRLGNWRVLEKLIGECQGISLQRDLRRNLQIVWTESGGPQPERTWTSSRLGLAFFDMLFPKDSHAYALLGQSCQIADYSGRCLRLKLELHPELANLPWEMIKISRDGHLGVPILTANIAMVRYLGDLGDRKSEIDRTSGVKPYILVVKADPRDRFLHEMTLSFRAERDAIVEVLRGLEWIGYEVIEDASTLHQLADRVERLESTGRPVVGLHFIGHGGIGDQGGFLLGEGDSREAVEIDEEQLRRALEPARSLQWVLFNACSTASEPVGFPLTGLATSMAVLKKIPVVIAYKRSVLTQEAEILASRFYTQVVKIGAPIESVVREIQFRFSNLSGLVLMVHSVDGRVRGIFEPAKNPRPDPERSETRDERDPRAEKPAAGTRWGAREGRARADDDAMVLVPAGPCPLGLSDRQIDRLITQFRRHGLQIDPDSVREALKEEPEREVHGAAFWIDLTPVTNAEFKRFVEAEDYVTEAEENGAPQNWRTRSQPDKADHPVVFVTYADAERYCRWASKRLPTQAEWIKAYRGKEGLVYPLGEEFDGARCNTAESQRGWQTTPVRMLPEGRSPYKCFDMVGNVEEWTSTANEKGQKIVLGGSWCMTCEVYGLPVLHRLARPGFNSNEQGFRCSRNA